jgi:hypothetical protein
MSIRSILVVGSAIATLGLGSPAFAASYGGYPMTAEACCRHITTRAGGTSAARPRREPHSSHHSRNLQDLATACTYSPAEGSPASRIPSLARTVRRPPVRAPRLAKYWFWGGLRY